MNRGLSRAFRIFAAAGLVALASQAPALRAGPAVPAVSAPSERVELVIDYSDGVEKRFKSLAWSEGMTVLDALELAKKSPHGITYESSGTGASAFVKKIDDLANEGGGSGKRNWIFRVNGKLGNRSCGISQLSAADKVSWTFGSPSAQ